MMRAIFLILLIGNAALFAHQYLSESSKPNTELTRPVDESIDLNSNLQLLSELHSANTLERQRSSESASIDETLAKQASQDADLCTMIGPYEQLLQAEYANERLNALGVTARIMPIEIHAGDVFWVYLKPEMSEKEALRRLYELQKKNIECHIIAQGDLANGISFGRFTDVSEAERKSEEIRSQGYDVAMKRLPKTIQETWLVVDKGMAEKVDDEIWNSLLSQQTNLEKRQNFCLGIASPERVH